MKKCTKCGKDVVSFQNKSKRCQPCRTAAHRDYCQRVGYHKKRYAKESVAERERHLVKKYGVTLVVYDAMLKQALEALELAKKKNWHDNRAAKIFNEAITAIKQRIGE